MGLKRRSCKLGKPVNVVQDVIKTVPLVQCSTSGARIVTISSLRSELKRIPGDQRRKELGDIDTLTKEKINAHLFLFSFWSMTFLGLVEAFEYDGESSPKCFFSRMRSVSTTSLLGRRKSKSDVKENFGTQVGNVSYHYIIWKRFYHVAWLLCPFQTSFSCVHRFICFGYCIWDWRTSRGAFTKLDFEAYNGPSRGYNQLGSIGYNTEQFFLQLRKQQFHVSKNCLRLACTRLEVVAGELSKSCHGRQQKQNCFWIGERCIVHFKLHAACFLIYQCN
ncbi:uncharacterized protein [Coffea arabica]|uniref:Uncharacterized protein isoform X2 n=1 Tax=Coffea arabica TaxID=13443 RepID=A0ABM4UAN5_COFAR